MAWVTWDERKRRENRAKHRVDIALAVGFEFETALVEEDLDVGYEQRFRAIGLIGSKLYFLAFTLGADDEPHAISLRPATPREPRYYVQNV